MLGLVDVFVWVTDPQKYADARLHRDYLTALAGHDAVTLVVLNQADRLTPEAVAACRKDLGRLLRADGLDVGEVLVTSARDGSGVVDLQHRVSVAVAGRTAAVQRLDGDVRSVAGPAAGRGGRHRATARRARGRRPRRRAHPRRGPARGAGRGPTGLPPGGVRPHRVAVHPVGAPAATGSVAPPASGHADRRRHAWRRRHHRVGRPCGAGTFVVAAGDARSAVGGRAGHAGARRPGGRAAAATVVAVGGRRGYPARRRPRRRPGRGGDAHAAADAKTLVVGSSQSAAVASRPGRCARPGLAGGAGRHGLAAVARAGDAAGGHPARCRP